MVEQSLRQVSAARSIVVDEDDTILAGNATVAAAAQVGIDYVRIIGTDCTELVAVRRIGLTDAQKMRHALYDNRTATQSGAPVDRLVCRSQSRSSRRERSTGRVDLHGSTLRMHPKRLTTLEQSWTVVRCSDCRHRPTWLYLFNDETEPLSGCETCERHLVALIRRNILVPGADLDAEVG